MKGFNNKSPFIAIFFFEILTSWYQHSNKNLKNKNIMVTKSFGKRNFMQPMGRPKHALNVPCFFSFYVLGLGGGQRFFFIFPSFLMCSHYVPFKFPMGSQYFPQYVLHTTSLLSHMPWKMVSFFHLYRWAKGEELNTSK